MIRKPNRHTLHKERSRKAKAEAKRQVKAERRLAKRNHTTRGNSEGQT
jgi:hypothetical protein